MSQRRFATLATLCGILGFVVLTSSFIINPGPPQGATIEQVMSWGRANVNGILIGGWTQGIGTMLDVIFMFALVSLADAGTSFAGTLTKYAATVVTAISLVEIAGYFLAVASGQNNDSAGVAISLSFIKSVQHLYFISLPVMLPLGFVVLQSRLLPRLFGYLAIALGVIFLLTGIALFFIASDAILFIVPSLSGLWLLATAVTLIFTGGRVAEKVAA